MQLQLNSVLTELDGQPIYENTRESDTADGCLYLDRLTEERIKKVPPETAEQIVQIPAGKTRRYQKQRPMILGNIIITALMTVLPDDAQLSADEKLRMVRLGMACSGVETADIKAEDVGFIKERINRVFPSALIVTRAYELIDPSPVAAAAPVTRLPQAGARSGTGRKRAH